MRWIVAAVAALALAVLGAASWLLYTEPGLRWAAETFLPEEIRLEGLRGTLAGDLYADSMQYQRDGNAVHVREAALRLELLSIVGGRAGVRSLEAQSLDIALAEAAGAARSQGRPDLPLGVRIDRARIERIRVQRGGEQHVVESFELRDAVVLQSGAVSATARFGLRHERYPVAGELRIGGRIERVDAAFIGRVAEVPVSARAALAPFAPRPLDTLELQAGPLDLARLDADWPRTALTVKLSGKASAAHALAGSLSARNAAPGPLDAGRVPLAAVESRFSSIDLSAVTLQGLKVSLSPRGVLAGSGSVSADRAEFDLRVSELDLSALGAKLHSTRLSGDVRLASAAAERQTLEGTLAQDGMRISADVVREGAMVSVRRLLAQSHGGSASGRARLRLGEPLRFEANLALEQFDPARFGAYPAGDINGSVEASGTLGPEPIVDARWVVERSSLEGRALESRGAARFSPSRAARVVAQASFGGARLTARGDLGRPGDELGWALEVPRLDAFVEGIEGRLQASGTLSGALAKPQASFVATGTQLKLGRATAVQRATLKASGSLDRHDAEVSVQADSVNANARLRGGWGEASGWSGEVLAITNTGPYPLQLRAPVPLRVARERVQLGRLDAALGSGRLQVSGLEWSDGRLRSSGEFIALPAQWLIVAAGLTEQARASLLVDGSWDMTSTPRLTGTATVRRSSGDVTLIEGGELALGLKDAQIEARFIEGRILANGELAARYADASVEADIAPEPGAPGLGITAQSALAFEARIRGVELRALAQPLLEDARIEGRLAGTLRGRGTLGKPLVSGDVRGQAIGFEMPPLGVFLRNGQLRATLQGNTLRLDEFSIQGGDGRFTASGELPLALAAGGARIAWRAEKFALLERPDLRLVGSGSGAAGLADKRISLSGSLRADRGNLELEQERLPRLGDDVVIVGRERQPERSRPTRVPVALDLHLDLGDDLEVRGFGLEGKLAGQIQVETTPEGELRAYGRIRTVNATFLAYGQRLQVDPGIAIFDGPLDNPSLQMTAWRRNQQVEVGVQVSGNARAPRVQLVSQPPVPEAERLSWLVLGRAPTDATKADLGLLQAAAGALLARGDRMPLDRRIAQAFGLDEISLRGSGEVADRVVAVGKRLSDRLYVSYEQGLGAAASALVKLDFALTQRLAVRAETGTSSGIGLFYRFSWD